MPSAFPAAGKRDFTEQVDRVVQIKLAPRFPIEVIDGTTDEQGQTPRGCIPNYTVLFLK